MLWYLPISLLMQMFSPGSAAFILCLVCIVPGLTFLNTLIKAPKAPKCWSARGITVQWPWVAFLAAVREVFKHVFRWVQNHITRRVAICDTTRIASFPIRVEQACNWTYVGRVWGQTVIVIVTHIFHTAICQIIWDFDKNEVELWELRAIYRKIRADIWHLHMNIPNIQNEGLALMYAGALPSLVHISWDQSG